MSQKNRKTHKGKSGREAGAHRIICLRTPVR